MATTTNASLAVYSGLAGDIGSKVAFKHLAVGTGTLTESAGHTGLATEVTGSGLTRALAAVTQQTTGVADNTLQLVKEWSVTGTVSISEVGAFNALSSGTGTMAFREKLSSVKNVVSGDTYTLTAKIIFS